MILTVPSKFLLRSPENYGEQKLKRQKLGDFVITEQRKRQ